MSEQVKTGILEKEYTRRQFLKMSGKGLAGLTMTAAMLSLFGCSEEEVEAGVVDAIAIPQGMLVVNRSKCTGCQRCETNCTLINDGKAQPHLARLKMRDSIYVGEEGVGSDYQHGDGNLGLWGFAPKLCRQCKDPACVKACAKRAIHADEKTGARVVDEEKCIGCGACTAACPWHMPTVDEETMKSTKCITCGYCASGCPTNALSIVTWEDIAKASKLSLA